MSKESLNWGILATGGIAKAFAKGVSLSKTGKLVAVGSRSRQSADEFAKSYGGTAYGSYEEVLQDPAVEAVYIALPHSMHEEWTIRCAEAGKGVLCEKPFTLDAESARRALHAVKSNDVFFAEAFMYRMHPQTVWLKEFLSGGELGEIGHVHSEFSFHVGEDWQNFRMERKEGGGGLMDVGTYSISMIRLAMGAEPIRCEFAYKPGGDGYDATGAGLLAFPGGRTATFSTGVHLENENHVRIYGSQGWLEIDSPWFCRGNVTVHIKGSEAPVTYGPWTVEDLYANEADVCAKHWSDKQVPMMTPDDSLNNMIVLDKLRASAGLSFQ